MALSHPGPRTGRGERRHCDPRPLGVRTLAAGGWGLPSRCLLGGGRALRKEAASSHRPGSAPAPAPAGTLTLVDGFESAREVAVLAITVHFTPEHRHRNPPTTAARHLGGDAGRPLAPEEDLGGGQAEKEAGGC